MVEQARKHAQFYLSHPLARDVLALAAEVERLTGERDALNAEADGLREQLYTDERIHERKVAAEAEAERRDQRDDWLRKQLDGCIHEAGLLESILDLATARVHVSNLRTARAALADPGDLEYPDDWCERCYTLKCAAEARVALSGSVATGEWRCDECGMPQEGEHGPNTLCSQGRERAVALGWVAPGDAEATT